MQLALGVFLNANGVSTESLTVLSRLKITRSPSSISKWVDEQAKVCKKRHDAELGKKKYFFVIDNINKYQSPRHFGPNSDGGMLNATMRFAFLPRLPTFPLQNMEGCPLPDDFCFVRVRSMITSKVQEIFALEDKVVVQVRTPLQFEPVKV